MLLNIPMTSPCVILYPLNILAPLQQSTTLLRTVSIRFPPSTTGRAPVILAIVTGLDDANEASAPSAPATWID